MKGILKYKNLNKLKSVYRFNTVENRKESVAEHTWGCLVLADYILNKTKIKVNRLKVYEMLMYHDTPEIITGDFVMHPKIVHNQRNEKTLLAGKKLKKMLPKEMGSKVWKLIKEFEEQKTKEAKFAKAIDQFEAEIHELDYKQDWDGWTEEYLRNKKEKYLKEFPEILEMFNKNIKYLIKNGYFNVK